MKYGIDLILCEKLKCKYFSQSKCKLKCPGGFNDGVRIWQCPIPMNCPYRTIQLLTYSPE